MRRSICLTILILLAGTLSVALDTRPVLAASASGTVVATIHVGHRPLGLAYDPANHDIYVANSGSNTTSVIDSATNTVIGTMPVRQGPWDAMYDPASQDVYVSDHDSSAISVISSSTNTVVSEITGGITCPFGMAYDPTNNFVYASECSPDGVSIINATTNILVATIPIGNGVHVNPWNAVFDPANQDVYIMNPVGNSTTVVNSAKAPSVVATIPLAFDPVGAAFDPANGNVYIAGSFSTQVIDSKSNAVVANISSAPGPFGVAFNPLDNNMYIASGGALSIVDSTTNAVVGTIPVGTGFLGFVVFNPSNNDLYVTDIMSDSVFVVSVSATTPAQMTQSLINTSSQIKPSLAAPVSHGVALLDSGKTIPVCNMLSAIVNQLNANVATGRLSPVTGATLLQLIGDIKTALRCG